MNKTKSKLKCAECEHYEDIICQCSIFCGSSKFPVIFEPSIRFSRYNNKTARTNYI